MSGIYEGGGPSNYGQYSWNNNDIDVIPESKLEDCFYMMYDSYEDMRANNNMLYFGEVYYDKDDNYVKDLEGNYVKIINKDWNHKFIEGKDLREIYPEFFV